MRPRTVRAVAMLCALMMVASNAIAAIGLCVAKTAPITAEQTVFDQVACPDHEASGKSTPEPRSTAHCPQDDPSAQVRGADLPVVDLPVLLLVPRAPLALPPGTQPGATHAVDSPPTPLYTSLSRLLL